MPPVDQKQPEGDVPAVDRIVIGRIARPHGVMGEVKIIALTNVAGRFQPGLKVILEFENGRLESHSIVQARGAGDTILELDGIETREDAERCSGTYITVPRSEVPRLDENTFYSFDLIGMEVVDSRGERIGSVTEIESYPANNVLVIEGEKGEIMVPLIREYVLGVDTAARIITIRLPEVVPPDWQEKTD